MSDKELIRRIAARYLIARDFFEIGDQILFGKYKNKKGVIVGWGEDHKGNPTVFIDPIPKGRKKTKEMGLFKFWHNPPPLIKKQQEEAAAQEALGIKVGCIIAGRKFDEDLCLFKTRDRAYDSEVEVVHVEKDGTEMAVIYDPKTGYIEGVNEHGIGVVNTALAVARDEAEGKTAGKGKGPMKSKDGPKIFKALAVKTLKDAIQILITEGGGIKGHTFVGDGKELVCIECSRTHPARVTKLDMDRTNTRTNHGISYPDAGYTQGDDYVSSIVRRWEAQKRIQDVKHPEDIGPALMDPIHKGDSPFNPVRDTDKMRTTSQLLINTTRPRMVLYLIPGHGSLKQIRNMLPGKRDPKIPVRVIQYEGEDDEVMEKDASLAVRVAARHRASENRTFYFAYGSNLDSARMLERVPSAIPMGSGIVEGWGFRFNKLSKDGSARANIVPGAGQVWGVLYQVPPEAAQTLDRIEGGYHRIAVDVAVGDTVVTAFTYESRRLTEAAAPDWYRELCVQGAQEHGAPPAYVEEIRKAAVQARTIDPYDPMEYGPWIDLDKELRRDRDVKAVWTDRDDQKSKDDHHVVRIWISTDEHDEETLDRIVKKARARVSSIRGKVTQVKTHPGRWVRLGRPDIELVAEFRYPLDKSKLPRELLVEKRRYAKSRYKSKKKVKKQDGEDMTVYEYSDRQIADRNREKAKRIEGLRKSVDKLRTQVKKDLKSSDDKTSAVALAVGLMDHTFERVGNEGSAKEGHFGVTTWKVSHVKFSGGKATISYVGKSGVDQKKTVTDAALVKALKASCKDKSKNACVVDAKASDVNAYLKPFEISAKDIRGFHANTEMKAQLKKVRSGKLPSDKKEKEKKLKEEFKKALEATADAVGHQPSTLKSQYLVPGLEDDYMRDGTINESHTKKGGRKEKDESQREDEQAQKMLRPEPKLKPPRYDLRNNRTLKERDKDMEGMDKQDGGDEDLQKDVRRQARRVAFQWLALPREPSVQRLLMRTAAAPDAAQSTKGKAHRSKDPENPGWIGNSPTGVPHFFPEGEFAEDKAQAYAKGEKFEEPKKEKKRLKDKEEPEGETRPDEESDVTEEPTDEEVADGELEDEEEAQAEVDTQNELNQATKEQDAQQQVVDDLMQELEEAVKSERGDLEETIIDEKAKLKKLKDKVEEISNRAEEEPKEEKPKEEKPKEEKAKPKKPKTPEEKQQAAEDEIERLSKILDDNADETGELNDFEKKKYERELGEARESLGAMNATKAENTRTEKLTQELADAELKSDPKSGKIPADFRAQAREQVRKEMAKERRQKSVGEANKIVTDLIGPGSTLPKDIQESMTRALGDMDDKQAAEFATSFKEQIEGLVGTPGDGVAGRNIANRAAAFEGYDGIKDPKELAKRAAEAAYAKNVVANPKILGGTPVSDTEKSPEQIAARITESVAHYRELDHSLRVGAAETLAEELKAIDPKSNRAKELKAILTGIATASVLTAELSGDGKKFAVDPTVPGGPQPSVKSAKLLQAMDRQGNLEAMFTPMSEGLTSPAGRKALREGMKALDNEDLVDQITDGDSNHPLNPLAELLGDEDLDEEIREVIRQALIGMSIDSMTWGDAAIREVTNENDPNKRQSMLDQDSKERRAFVSEVVDAAKSGETAKFVVTNSEEDDSGFSNDEGASLLDVLRSQQVSDLLNEHSEGAEAVPSAPSAAILREYMNSKDPSVLETEVSPTPEEFRSAPSGKKSGSKSQLSVYRMPQLGEGPSLDSVQSPAPTNRRQTSMPKITETGARQVTANLDRLAELFQTDFATLGLPQDVASDMALRCDMLSDRIESHAGLRPRQAQMDPPANYTEEKVAPNEFNPAEIGEESSQAFLRNEDEPYMDSFTQDENDQLRMVQQDGMFSNAKAASELIRKLQARLAASQSGDSAQKKTELSDELARFAASLDNYSELDDKLAKFHEAAGIGKWNEMQAAKAVAQLEQSRKDLADVRAEIEALAGEVLLKKADTIEKDYAKRLKQFKEELPETAKGQGAIVLHMMDAVIKYTKVAEQKRPGAMQMIKELNADPDAAIKDRGGDLIGRIEERVGAIIAAQVAEVYDTVMEELTALRPVVRGLKLELKQKNASTSGIDKEAGVMSLLVKFRDWVMSKSDKLKRLFGMGTKRIDNASKRIDKAIAEANKGWTQLEKRTASDMTAGEVPEAFKENIQKMKDKAKDKDGDKDDEKSDDKKDDKDSGKPWEKDKKASHGFDLTA